MIAIVVATIYAEKSSVQSDVNKRLTPEFDEESIRKDFRDFRGV